MSEKQRVKIYVLGACVVLPMVYLWSTSALAGPVGKPVSPAAGIALATAALSGVLLCFEGLKAVLREGSPKKYRGGDLTHEELVQACNNIGYDLTCGKCAGLFYTGMCLPKEEHDHGCSTLPFEEC